MSTMAADSLLDAEAVSRAEALGLHARFVVEGYIAGEHKSPYHGFAAEFAQHREYAPGDDTRHIDWKVLARTDRHYVKQYEQETNYVAHILVDGSQSMNYGSGALTKLHYAKMMAACLAYLILTQRDAVALALFDTELREKMPRSDNKETIHKIIARLARFQARADTNIAAILHQTAGQIRRRGIVIVISDFFDDEEKVLEGLQHLRFGGNEVIVFQILDPYELEFPFSGIVEFEGLESAAKVLTRPGEVRETYLREFGAFQRRLRNGCERNQCHFVQVNTAHSLCEVLSSYLAFRLGTTH